MHYTGTWNVVSSYNPTNPPDSVLNSVATDASDHVWAVGASSYPDPQNDNSDPLIERWNGTSFVNDTPTGLGLGSITGLSGVAVVSDTLVWTIGISRTQSTIYNSALLLRKDTNGWSIMTSPNPGTENTLTAVTVDDVGDVRAVGYTFDGLDEQPLFARWFSSTGWLTPSWHIDTQVPTTPYLRGVAAATAGDAWAVGTYTLTEHYDGAGWEVIPALAVGNDDTQLHAVAVGANGDAWAVGYYSDYEFGPFYTLIEHYPRPATPSPPSKTTSHYISTISTTVAYTEGFQQARNREQGITILAFGDPAAQGTLSGTILHDAPNFTFASTNTIASYAKAFASGYYSAALHTISPSIPNITITLGTTNFSYTTTVMQDASKAQAHGRQWAYMVNDVFLYLKEQGYYPLVRVAGGDDMELEWNDPARTTAWAQGYNAIAQWAYYNFGACEGCPDGMSNGWTIADVYSVTWGIPRAQPFPQIYATDGTNAGQWRRVSLYSFNGYNHMIFAGALTQYDACQTNGCKPQEDNTPAAGWTQLWRTLNFDARTSQPVLWVSDISWDQ